MDCGASGAGTRRGIVRISAAARGQAGPSARYALQASRLERQARGRFHLVVAHRPAGFIERTSGQGSADGLLGELVSTVSRGVAGIAWAAEGAERKRAGGARYQW